MYHYLPIQDVLIASEYNFEDFKERWESHSNDIATNCYIQIPSYIPRHFEKQ